ncbi:AbiH family protein [Companilactobacillus sp. HBUAS56275]|uniref:AbiH family protein n=1 Tax=Companilactobacillus sp. HBUAS56275 TaxID=3109364 RepID=UPI002FF1AF22
MKQINEIKSLIILGNGFDLRCGLPSRFWNFFEELNKSTVNEDFGKLRTFFKSDFKLHGFSAYPGNRNQRINLSEYNWFEMRKYDFPEDSEEKPEMENDQEFSDLFSLELRKLGFWTSYFVIFCSNSKNWYNIEESISTFFTEESDLYGKKNTYRSDSKETRFSAIDKYIKGLKKVSTIQRFSANEETDLLTRKLALLLLSVFEYKPDTDLSEFLLNQLKIFENLFDSYLIKKSSSNVFYKPETEEVLERLSDGNLYNLLNFNYTMVKSENTNIRRNIHSTLGNKPIIGIDADKVFADNRVYKFTKTYRIMRLAMRTDDSELIPQSINEIIFYGHSLAQADYSYFQSIFDKCNIYNNDIKLVFYYSTYDGCNEEQATRTMFNRVSQLLDNYGKTIPNHGKNLLSKMLLENRIRIKEL